MDTANYYQETRVRSLLKAFSWRILAACSKILLDRGESKILHSHGEHMQQKRQQKK